MLQWQAKSALITKPAASWILQKLQPGFNHELKNYKGLVHLSVIIKT